MKFLLLSAVMILAVQGGPVLKAIDWGSVWARVDIMQITITDTFDTVILTATEDDSRIGHDIEAKLQPSFVKYVAAFEQIYQGVSAQNLTEPFARERFAEIRSILEEAMADIASDIAQLSSGAREKINAALVRTEAFSKQLAQEVLAILSEGRSRKHRKLHGSVAVASLVKA